MLQRFLALPWVVGSLLFGCDGKQREFGERPLHADGGSESIASLEAGTVEGVTGDAGVASGALDSIAMPDSAPMPGSAAMTDAGAGTDDSASTGADAETDTSGGEDTSAVPAGPTLDGVCTTGGVRACDVSDPKQTLVCSQGRWQSNGGCSKKDNCDPSVGACSEVVAGCAELTVSARYCKPGDELWECGPNLVTEALIENCEGKCVSSDNTSVCATPECGDGKIQTDEACDDADDDNEDECTILCKPPACGDGLQHSTELCDDGNADEGDECTSKCAPPSCGDEIVQPWEDCDDGNADEHDECTTLCAPPTCGDGITHASETCDDGNLHSGDGCSAGCVWEVIQVVSKSEHTCALRADGRVKCWGYNPNGQLGLGVSDNIGDNPDELGAFLPEVDLGTGRTALQVSVGVMHSCALLDNHRVKCWGHGDAALGYGDTVTRGDTPDEMGDNLPEVDLGVEADVEQVVAGFYHTCARLSSGRVKCWGRNSEGQLGMGDIEVRGDALADLGDNLQPVDLGKGRTAQHIAAGSYHTCALLDNSDLKCWGYNADGELGQGHNKNIGVGVGEMGDDLPPIDLGVGRYAVSVVANYYNTCALLDTGALKCWGYNTSGQLGQGDTDTRAENAGEMGDSLKPIDLGAGRTALAATIGYDHVCAILDTHELKCWGGNYYGQLGLESPGSRGDQPYEMGDYLPAVALGTDLTARQPTAGYGHVCAALSDGNVKCWGYNGAGELGQGHLDTLGNVPGHMGDNLTPVELW